MNNTLFRLGSQSGWCTPTHFFDHRMRGPVDFSTVDSATKTLRNELPRLPPLAGACLYFMAAMAVGQPEGKAKKYFGHIDRVEIIPDRTGVVRVVYNTDGRELLLRAKVKDSRYGNQLDLLVERVQ